MTEETYNGWPSRETWMAALWLSSEESLWQHVGHLGAQALAKYPNPDDADLARLEYARSLETEFDLRDSDLVQALPGLYRDLLGAAWYRIDWEALAGTWLEDAV